MVEIYALCDPDTGEVRYVGKANKAAERYKRHLNERGLGRPVNNWVKVLIAAGKSPILKILAIVPDDQWEQAEREQIAEHRKVCRLLNLADGGAMPSQTVEQRKSAARASNKAQAKKSPAEIEFIKAKQDMARLHAKFTKDGKRSGNYFHAYVMRLLMKCYYANDPERHATWANL